MENWLQGFLVALNFHNIIWLFLGTVWGLFIGVLPALGPNFAVAIMLPFTYGMDTASAMIFLCAAHASCNYGDSLASILVNIPGGPGTVATCWDGYPMARQGKAMRALGIATFASCFGGILTWFSLVLLAKPIGNLALTIGAPEYFALGVMALSLVAVAGRGETLKGILMTCVGLLIAAIGMDPVTGSTYRFSFGIVWLQAGVPLVVSALGIFAITQLIHMLEEKSISGGQDEIRLKGTVFSGFMDVVRRPMTLLRAGLIGWIIGILPALGVSLAGISSYLIEKKYSKEKEDFGKGSATGLVAAEVGKGACVVGDLVPSFTLGVPGSITGAILMAALILHGVEPGPRFLVSGSLPYIVFAGLLLGQLAYALIGPLFCRLLARTVFLPNALLVPFIAVLAFLGAYTERNYTFDLILLVLFGIIGYILERYGYSLLCIVLGLILGDLVETNLTRALAIGFDSPVIFLHRPIAIAIFAITFLFLIGPFLLSLFRVKGPNIEKEKEADQSKIVVTKGEVILLLIMAFAMIMSIVAGRSYAPRVRRFPEFVAEVGLLILLWRSMVLAWSAFKQRGQTKDRSGSDEEKIRPVVPYQVSMALLIGYALLTYVCGFVATTCLFVLVTAFVAGYRKPVGLSVMVVGAGAATLLFARILNVILPEGLIYNTFFY